MNGPATASQGHTFIANQPQPSHPAPSPSNNSDQFANSNVPRGQVNAWGWPSGFNNQMSVGNVAGPSKPGLQNVQGQVPNMHNGQAQNNAASATIYPPQPYGNPTSFAGQAHTSSPSNANLGNAAGKGKAANAMPGGTPTMGGRKRGASKSPEVEGKEKRSRPDDAAASLSAKQDQNTANSTSSEERMWGEEATKLDVYVWDYLTRRGFGGAAKALMSEAGMAEPPEVPLKTPQGLLFEYWAIFWDVFAARTGRGSSEATAYFEYQESRQMQRLMDASRKSEALETAYQAPEHNGRFPSIAVAGVPVDPASANGRPLGQPVWNPAALSQAQQQQLLITAAQRQNIPIHEIKNLTPATRMALINSVNPHNPVNQQAIRPGMGNQQMEQQLQARLQQQQALHRMMQQQRQAGAVGPGQQLTAGMQVRPPMGPQGGAMSSGSPAHPGGGLPGIQDGRRSVGPGQGPPQDPNRPDGQPGQMGQPGQGPQPPQQLQGQQRPPQQQQHPQLNPQQQQAVITQYQNVQAAMREEWMKAQNAPNQTTAQDFYANVQSYQAKASSLQALLRAQTNFQQAQQGGPAAHMQQAIRPGGPQMMPGTPGGQPMPPNMANLTPQQRAAQLANAQAAAGRITPAMATHDPGLMTSMMGPGNVPNGTVGGPRPHDQHQPGMPGGPGQGQPGMGGMDDARARAMQPQQQPPQRPPSSQGRPEDPNQSHFAQTQFSSSPAQMPRPTMQRTASAQLAAGGMGPPGPQSMSSPSPRTQPGTLQQQNSQGTGSPAPNVPSTPKMGAEKMKKGATRQRKNSKATTKTPTLTAASVSGNNGAAPSTNGPGASTPAAAQAQTPASTSAPTPGRDAAPTSSSATAAPTPAAVKSSDPAPLTSQSMPPPTGVPAQPQPSTDADSNNGLTNDDFSMFGFGGSMNDIFDFDLSTDGSGTGGTGDVWDTSNFGSLFAGGDGA